MLDCLSCACTAGVCVAHAVATQQGIEGESGGDYSLLQGNRSYVVCTRRNADTAQLRGNCARTALQAQDGLKALAMQAITLKTI